MRSFLTTAASVAAVLAGLGVASAADLPRAYPAPVVAVPVAAYNWTGFYAGVNVGGVFGNSEHVNVPLALGHGQLDPNGVLLGGQIGYNYQINQFVLGVEGDLGWTNAKDNNAITETKARWLGTARARVGVAFDTVMPYLTGGFAFGNIRAQEVGFPAASKTMTGWTVGGGIEAALWSNWTAKAEYLYVDLGDKDFYQLAGQTHNIDFKAHVIKAGLNYRF